MICYNFCNHVLTYLCYKRNLNRVREVEDETPVSLMLGDTANCYQRQVPGLWPGMWVGQMLCAVDRATDWSKDPLQ